jgi:hypothetical protein
MPLVTANGKVASLRVNERGDRFGPSGDNVVAEVIVKLDSQPSRAYWFRLLDDADLPVRRGYLDLLRDALTHGHDVHLDADLPAGKSNGEIIRCTLTPAPRPRQLRAVLRDPAVIFADE